MQAQELPSYKFQYLMIDDGLPQNTINCIAKDNYGFMWIGTNNGVCRYDSYSFEVFSTGSNHHAALTDNMIHDIDVDAQGRIWLASSNGLSYFDPSLQRFRSLNDLLGKYFRDVRSIQIVGNNLWTGSGEAGVYCLNISNNNVEIAGYYSYQNRGVSSNNVNVLFCDSQCALFAGTDSGAFVYDPDADRFMTLESETLLPPNTTVNDIFEDSQGRRYYSTNNGLYIYYNNLLVWHSPDPSNSFALNHGVVKKVSEDVLGHILVATYGGLHLFYPDDGTFRTFPLEGQEGFILNNEFVNTLFCDREGNVWIGTDKGGINKYNVYQNPFRYITHVPDNPNSLNVNTVNSIYDEGNFLWIGTAGGGLNRIDKQSQIFKHYISNPLNQNTLSGDFISAIERGSDGTLWVSTWGDGLNALETRQNEVRIRRINPSHSRYTNSLVNTFISALVDNSKGYLLIGTEGGLSMLNYKNNHFTTLVEPEDFEHEITEIGCMLLDSKGFYWLGTREGLFRFPEASIRPTRDDQYIISQLQYFKHEDEVEDGLPGNYIISLMESENGYIWIGTYGNGLVRASVRSSGKINCKTYTTEDGLSNNVIYGIVEDQEEKIWVSTDIGLSMLDPATGKIKRFYKEDGLLDNQFYWSAFSKGKDKTLYFGGIKGLNYFNPTDFYDYNYFPQPRITSFKIHNEEVIPGKKYYNKTAIYEPIYSTDTIYLNYRSNNISFEFSSFDYYLPDKSRYEFYLEGVDKEPINVSASRRYANYNNLEGAEYIFHLKASNCDGIWNEESTQITIIIKPPFWKTTWFIFVTVITTLLLIFLYVRMQLRRVVAQKKILEDRVQRRTAKIEDQKILLEKQANDLMILNDKVNEVNKQQLKFFTNISHEFQTPLTLIISPLERLIKQYRHERETKHLLEIIQRNSQRLLLLIRQLLEIRKIETGHQTLQVEITELEPFLRGVYESFEEMARKNSISYHYDIKVERPAWVDKAKLEDVIYNLLSNAFKFTPEMGSISLEARLKAENGSEILSITVSDTGEGIPEDQLELLFDRFVQLTRSKKHSRAGAGIGLSMVKSLVELMHGTIEVKSVITQGSEFKVLIPVNRNAFEDHEIDTTGQVFASNLRDRVALLDEQIFSQAYQVNIEGDETLDSILIVEDNDELRYFMSSHLASYYRVSEAENGAEGYRKAQKETPSVIVSDVMMPEMNGLEMCKKLKNNLYTSHIPLILLTAKTREEDHIQGLEMGADDYITKPFNIEILLARIRTLIQNRKIVKDKFGRLEEVKPDEMKVSVLDNKFYARADEIVGKYFSEPSFDVDQFASEMLVSRSQLYSKLKAITNLSANEFINTYRLKKAVELLENGELHISEVAYSTGFNDPKYFSRIFKKYYHKSPSDFFKK